ncbi:MAG: threonine synthase, partial [Parvularculaceae bacterium]|nr:threonine synthase [Parvularculaceae bacterium]
MTLYVSTRSASAPVGFRDALLGGLAPDGGLYVPQAWPRLGAPAITAFDPASFPRITAQTLAPLTAPWIDAADLQTVARAAFGGFAQPDVVAPLRKLSDDLYILELFHGPTLAFKDVAMQLLAPLFSRALAETGEEITLVAATSGDTGGAAVAAFAGAP